MNIYWLVERHTLSDDRGIETVNWHTIIKLFPSVRYDGPSVASAASREAFRMAELQHRIQQTGNSKAQPFVPPSDLEDPAWRTWTFEYAPEELEEAVEGYLWQAADGSSVAYEVRRIDLS